MKDFLADVDGGASYHGQSLPARSLVTRRGIAEETVHDTGLRGIQRNPILGGILER